MYTDSLIYFIDCDHTQMKASVRNNNYTGLCVMVLLNDTVLALTFCFFPALSKLSWAAFLPLYHH